MDNRTTIARRARFAGSLATLASAAALLVGSVSLGPGGGALASEGNEFAPVAEKIEPVQTKGLGSLSGYYLAARHADFSKDIASAAGFYQSALMKDPDHRELLDRSMIMNVASGNVARGAELAQEVLDQDSAEQLAQLALITLAAVELRKGEVDAVLGRAEELAALGGQLQELMAGLIKAWAMAAKGEADDAIASLDSLNGPAWFETFTVFHAGLIADHAGLNEIAAERLSQVHESDAGSHRAVDAYARHLARNGQNERATSVIEEFEERIGGNRTFTEGLREEIAAGAVAPKVADPRHGLAEALYGIGSAVGADGGDTFAASLLQLALHLAPEAYYPAMALAQVQEAMGQHEDAIETYRAIPLLPEEKRSARVQEALNLNILERHDEAIALLTDLVDEDPQDVSTAVALGNVYRSRERFQDAARAYSQSIESFDEVPESYWTLYYYRGISHERTGDWDAAEADFRKALELDPEQPLVLNYLGYSYIDRGENLEEALEMVRRAVEQRPEDGYIVDSLGWAYYRLGRYEDAVRELERAVSLKPGDPVINDHLGDAYWKVGRKLEAMFQWAHARDSEPEPDELTKILGKLANGLQDDDDARAVADAPDETEVEGDEPTAQ